MLFWELGSIRRLPIAELLPDSPEVDLEQVLIPMIENARTVARQSMSFRLRLPTSRETVFSHRLFAQSDSSRSSDFEYRVSRRNVDSYTKQSRYRTIVTSRHKKIHRQKPGRHNRIIVYIVNPVPLFLPASRLPSVQVF